MYKLDIAENVKKAEATLLSLGFRRPEAKLLAFLLKNEGLHTSRDVEIGVDMRQPEVSVAAKSLEHHGWIIIKELEKDEATKGRPRIGYTLAMPPDLFKDKLKGMADTAHNQTLEAIDTL